MSSRAWTEVAKGAEARSLRRWVCRAVLPRLVRVVVLLLFLLIAFDGYINFSKAFLGDPVCIGLCMEPADNNLDWEASDLLLF